MRTRDADCRRSGNRDTGFGPAAMDNTVVQEYPCQHRNGRGRQSAHRGQQVCQSADLRARRAGDRTLSWLQRFIAANWIKQLFKLAPKGTGVERINFLSTTRQQNLIGTRREHPLNDLLFETRITWLEAQGEFEMEYQFKVESFGFLEFSGARYSLIRN